jgi:hypothetical protein
VGGPAGGARGRDRGGGRLRAGGDVRGIGRVGELLRELDLALREPG